MTTFFVPPVPGWAALSDEEAYARLAELARSRVPAPDRRIAAIEFDSDGYTWTAEVGQTLRGERQVRRTRNKKKVDVTERTSDSATVLAIFAGVPHFVVTDKGLVQPRSGFVNPFMATAKRETYFDA